MSKHVIYLCGNSYAIKEPEITVEADGMSIDSNKVIMFWRIIVPAVGELKKEMVGAYSLDWFIVEQA